jgi:lipopolysaccharide export system protein LptA
MMGPRFSSIYWIQHEFWRYKIPKVRWSVLGLCWLFGSTHTTPGSLQSLSSGPEHMTLEAQNGVVCPEPGNLWIATGQVILKKGVLVIQADRIDLELETKKSNSGQSGHKNTVKHSEKSKFPLLQPILSGPVRCVMAKGNVSIHHPSLSLSAPWARYDFQIERMDALGPGIVLQSQKNPQETQIRRHWVLNCSKSLSYTQSTGMMYAEGKVRLISQGKGLESNRLCALFGPEKPTLTKISPHKKPFSKGLSALQNSLEAKTTPVQLYWARSDAKVRFWDKEKQIIAVSQSALWNAILEKGEMQGNVHIRHKDQYIRANKANLDFSSNTIGIMGQNWLYRGDKHGADTGGQTTCDPSKGVYALIPTSFSGKKG